MIQELNAKNFKEHTSGGLKLVEFFTDWCGYCQKQRPVIEDLSKNGVWIGTINADENPDIAEEFSISGFPSFVLFKDGKSISKISGYHDKSSLLSKLMEHIG